jgi:hypothetical protein
MPHLFSTAESVESIAQQAIPMFHPHLATARITYIFVDKASMKNGRPVLGKVRKVSGVLEYLLDKDFLVEIPLDQWNDLADTQRHALVDHLLERCYGEENEENGEMKWSTREPDVQEFSTILRRHGAWNDELAGFVSVAKTVNVDEMVQDAVAGADEVSTQV